MMPRAGEPTIDLMHCRPDRLVASEEEEDRVVLLRPRFLKGPLAWWLQPLLKRPFFRVRLDEVGSFVWRRCDGETTVEQIAGAMAEHFGEELAQLEQRLQSFLFQLERGQMIRMQMPGEEPDDEPGERPGEKL